MECQTTAEVIRVRAMLGQRSGQTVSHVPKAGVLATRSGQWRSSLQMRSGNKKNVLSKRKKIFYLSLTGTNLEPLCNKHFSIINIAVGLFFSMWLSPFASYGLLHALSFVAFFLLISTTALFTEQHLPLFSHIVMWHGMMHWGQNWMNGTFVPLPYTNVHLLN